MSPRNVPSALLLLLTLAACRGPDPIVERDALVAPERAGEPFQAEALVANRGGGSGQVGVNATLARRSDGQVLAEASRTIDLAPRQRAWVVLELSPPRSAREMNVEDLSLSVETRYPIE